MRLFLDEMRMIRGDPDESWGQSSRPTVRSCRCGLARLDGVRTSLAYGGGEKSLEAFGRIGMLKQVTLRGTVQMQQRRDRRAEVAVGASQSPAPTRRCRNVRAHRSRTIPSVHTWQVPLRPIFRQHHCTFLDDKSSSTATVFQHLVRNGIAWISVLQKAGFQ
jgi:hypothetical protein